jgi:aryl-alcohol dehydrogenase-like predicted oxidoreductase
MVRAIEGSLRRLKTDHVDFYWVHAEDRLTPMEEILRAFDDLSRDEKILYAGISNFPAWKISRGVTIAEAKNTTPIVGIQLEYNLVERSADRELLPMAEGLCLGAMFYSPLAHGNLSSTTAQIPVLGASRPEQLEDNVKALELSLSAEQLAKLESVSQIDLGNPQTVVT